MIPQIMINISMCCPLINALQTSFEGVWPALQTRTLYLKVAYLMGYLVGLPYVQIFTNTSGDSAQKWHLGRFFANWQNVWENLDI